MYTIETRSRRAEKEYRNVLALRQGIPEKLEKLKKNPRKECQAHKLHGFEGYWSCWLGNDIRMVYEIDDKNKKIIVVKVGSHKIYG